MNKLFDYSDLPRILIEAGIILAVGVLLGLTLHADLVGRVLRGEVARPAPAATRPAAEHYPEPVDLKTVQQQLAAGAQLVDARISELHREGHLPGSVSLPLDEYPARRDAFRSQVPANRPLITYCNGYGCPDSYDLAVRLLADGYTRVMVFEGGFPEWQDAGLPVVTGE